MAAQMQSDEHTAEASRFAAGSVIELTERVCRGSLRSGFALVRPPGHHAAHSSMQGFCFLNNIAIAARVAQQRHGVKRILVLDWDVHHGNGTEAMLLHEPGVLFVSLHRHTHNFYPRTGACTDVGAGAGTGYTLNLPWRRTAMGDREYRLAFEQVVMPVAAQFAPELVLVSAGFDASHGDPLGGMHLSPGTYAYMTRELQKLAGGRIVCALEGGYSAGPTARGVAAVLRALVRPEEALPLRDEALGLSSEAWEDERTLRAVDQSCRQTLNEVCRAHRQFWGVLHQRELHRQLRRAGAPAAEAEDEDREGEGGRRLGRLEDAAERLSLAPGSPPRTAAAAMAAGAAAAAAAAWQLAATVVAGAAAAPSAHSHAQPGQPPAARPLEPSASAASAPPALDTCRACFSELPRSAFGRSQWKRFPSGRRICSECAQPAQPHSALD